MVSFFGRKLIFFIFISVFVSFSQNLGLSPYSKTALGDISSETGNRDSDMGYTGVSNYSTDGFSIANPAFLHHSVYPNKPGKFTYFDFNISTKATKFNSSKESDQAFGGNLNRIALVVPINNYKRTKHKWGMAFVVKPYSSINYEYSGTESIANDSVSYTYLNNGNGGLSQVIWGNGVKLSKNFSLGLNSSFIFGKYTRQNQTKLSDASYTYSFTTENRKTFLNFQPGLSYTGNFLKKDSVIKYRDTIDLSTGIKSKIAYKVLEKTPTDLFCHIGLTYEYGFAQKDNITYTKKVFDEINNNSTIDTISTINPSKYDLPGEFKFGISLSNLEYRLIPNWALSFQVGYRQWSLYNPSLNYRNTLSTGIGFEKKALIGKNKNEKITFGRIGFYYNQLPYQFNNTYIDEKGITLGGTLNLPPIKGLGDRMMLNAGLSFGQRGTMSNNLISEKFIKVSLGFTFLEDRWFYKYKLD